MNNNNLDFFLKILNIVMGVIRKLIENGYIGSDM